MTRLVLAICVCALLSGCASTASGSRPMSPERAGALASAAGVPGLAMATLRDCRVDRVVTVGLADVGRSEPVTASTVFEAASLSKTVLSYLVWRLADEGRLDLDARIADRLASTRIADAARYRQLTPRLLLSHQSGLPNWSGDPTAPERTDTLTFVSPPGAAFGYSGEGFHLLQAYVTAVTGQSLDELFTDELGQLMPNSTFAPAVPAGLKEARGYDSDGADRPLMTPARADAAFSLRTTALDYSRFLGRVCDGGGLSASALTAARARQVSARGDEWGGSVPDGAAIGWSLGWGTQTVDGRTTYFHWGDNGFFKAFAALDPQARTGVVYFANGADGLRLIEPLAEPAVGSLGPAAQWLNYGGL